MTDLRITISGVARTNTNLARLLTSLPKIVDKVLHQEALELKKEIQTGLRNQAPGGEGIKPLAPMTQSLRSLSGKKKGSKKSDGGGGGGGAERKSATKPKKADKRKGGGGGGGGGKALIRTGFMLRSVNVTSVRGQKAIDYFVGIHRKSRSTKGVNLANVAEIHEFGTGPFQIPVSTKMRGFFFFLFSRGIIQAPLSRNTTAIMHPGIPERPFLRPAHKVWESKAQKRFGDKVAVMLASRVR